MKPLFSKPIMKQSLRSNWKLWVALTAVLCLVSITVAAINLPENLADNPDFSPLAMLCNQIFEGTGMAILIPLCIVIANRLVALEIDRGTMSFTLNTPTTRRQIIFSKAGFLVLSVFAMILLVTFAMLIGLLSSGKDFPMDRFFLLIFGFTMLAFAISGICFASSCWFNKSSHSQIVSSGVLLISFLFRSLSSMAEGLKAEGLQVLKYFSFNTLFDGDGIADGTADPAVLCVKLIALFAIGAGLYALGIWKFLKKDLPL